MNELCYHISLMSTPAGTGGIFLDRPGNTNVMSFNAGCEVAELPVKNANLCRIKV